MRADVEDDAMTEQTSRTDDDLLHDAFAFLDQGSGAEDMDDAASDEDEIVWDLRYPFRLTRSYSC
jgi:hypothetical protein